MMETVALRSNESMRASMSNAACVRPRRSAFLEIEFTLSKCKSVY